MKESQLPKEEYIIKPCTGKQLAAAYGVSPKILRNWLKPHQAKIGPRIGYYYSVEQVLLVAELIGFPIYPIGEERKTTK